LAGCRLKPAKAGHYKLINDMNLEDRPIAAMTYPPILRVWCALTAAATFTLIAVGSLVTTFRVGMADPVWPTAPWHLLLIDWQEPSSGFLIEHTHRIAGYVAGSMILIQTLALWYCSPRRVSRVLVWMLIALVAGGVALGMRSVRQSSGSQRSLEALLNPGFIAAGGAALGLLALSVWELDLRMTGRWQRVFATLVFLGVVVQGLLGGLRVYLNELRGPELAVIHGLFAQVIFTLSALLVLMTSTRWNLLTELLAEPRLRTLTAVTVILLTVQIVFGGLLRHLTLPLAERLHPILAFGVVLTVTLALARIFVLGEGWPSLRSTAAHLGVLVAMQVILGVEAWLRHPATALQPVGAGDAVTRSLHVLVGFGVFASASLLAARTWKAKLV
jgi:heme A synthase